MREDVCTEKGFNGPNRKVYTCSPSTHSQYCPKAALHPSYGWKDHQNEHNVVQNHAVGLPSLDLHRPRQVIFSQVTITGCTHSKPRRIRAKLKHRKPQMIETTSRVSTPDKLLTAGTDRNGNIQRSVSWPPEQVGILAANPIFCRCPWDTCS